MTTKTTGAGVDTCGRHKTPHSSFDLRGKVEWLSSLASPENRITRFLFVGGASVLVDCCVFFVLSQQNDVLWSKAISYVAGMIVGFLGNKFYTFQSRRRSWFEPLTYVLLYAVTFGANVGTCWCIHTVAEGIGFEWGRPLGFLVATAVSTVLNYLGMSLITFREGQSNDGAAVRESYRLPRTPNAN